MESLSKRAQEMGLPMTIEMAKKARELSATGKNVISLSLGEPDFDTPDFIKEAAAQAMEENYTHYMPVPGFTDVRESIAAKFKRDNGIDYTADQIVISTGAKQSLLNIFLALVNPGEEIIIPAPYWVSYMDQAKYCGAEVKVLPTTMEGGFKITADQLESAITPKSKVLIFSSPNNPCGAIYSKEDLKAIAAVVAKYPNLYIISDEIYELLNYGEVDHVSIASFPEVYNQTITVNGLSKGFAMTGWRLGYIGAPQWIAKACTKFQSNFTSGTNSIAQRACKTAVEADPSSVDYMIKKFASRREKMVGWIKEVPGFELETPPGAFYVFPRITSLLGKKFNGSILKNSLDVSMYLLEEGLVSTVPGDAFGLAGYIRFSYAAAETELEEAVKRVKVAVSNLED
ncbi:MAG: pyridoxal phosphate-dependent aminotransferase [Schleiferiaceae bacterium]|jgi:aspartate aminotransferase|nr:pyridoxal phosphate-dependent aminotransferase [Schleiferiaceae bacterium]MDG1313711.1 pyridoxal phosphate-dependent aminotransferase [Schleiferiaceae bacterium]MDG1918252.1 pyridoxal phosphate-dependent aminotransferase [Schleiferiaceae bacterium]MDG2110388.1 pyridoxal phosphate-dependent aminotransferase [Schleiferiaceae bacterium]